MIKHEDLIIGKTYLIDVGFSFKQPMIYRGYKGTKNEPKEIFEVTKHFMDSQHDNWEVGTKWSVSTHENISYYTFENSETHVIVEKPKINPTIKKEILDDLADIGNKYLSLESQVAYSSEIDNNDFCDAIHTCQRIVATQELRKQHPEFFE